MTDETPKDGTAKPEKLSAIKIAKHYALWHGNLRKVEEVILDLQDNLGALFGANEQGVINPTKMREWTTMTNKIQHALPANLDSREVMFVALSMARGAMMQLEGNILEPLEEAEEGPKGPKLVQ